MELITDNLAGFWFALGFVLMAIEILAFAFGSGVLLFGSLGALITGALVYFGVLPDNWLVSIGAFALASAASALVLWGPLKRMQSGSELGSDRSSDLIGHTFALPDDLSVNKSLTTRYSGIDWRVELDSKESAQTLASGTRVQVTAVNAGVFYVRGLVED